MTKAILIVTNKAYATTNDRFIVTCANANIKPTSRQASKWRNGKGAAYKFVTMGLE